MKKIPGSHPISLLVQECFQIYPDIPWIYAGNFLRSAQEKVWVVIDVRDDDERQVSVLPGAISSEKFLEREDRVSNIPMLVYCTIGGRSGVCVEDLIADGHEAYNLWGGASPGS